MNQKHQHITLQAENKVKMPVIFIAVCCFLFAISITATIYFYTSMCCDMDMPGGWSMSMMWMRMPDDTWLQSSVAFMLMWITMMIVMMMPSALPMFIKTGQQWKFLYYTATGYFTIWLLAGIVVYFSGIQLAGTAMRSVAVSKFFILLSGIVLIFTGAYQFTSVKIKNLLHCRSAFGCNISILQQNAAFKLGCRQGVVCCICCSGLMITQLIIGIMNPFAMIIVALAITVEKLFPKPLASVRIIGTLEIIAGIVLGVHGVMVIAA